MSWGIKNKKLGFRARGVTLALSLIILLLVTLIGVSIIHTAQLQEKMSYHMEDKNLSFEAAESVLQEGERWLNALGAEPIPTTSGCDPYPCIEILDPELYLEEQDSTWWGTHSALYSQTLSAILSKPRYIIEFLSFVSDMPAIGHGVPSGTYYYRVTGRGTGATDNAFSVVQISFARRY